jgi:hypothetical protein
MELNIIFEEDPIKLDFAISGDLKKIERLPTTRIYKYFNFRRIILLILIYYKISISKRKRRVYVSQN